MASPKSPGKAHRDGITLIELMKMFPDEATATKWFEDVVWSGERCCGHCGSVNTRTVPNAKPMPYWCPDCRSYFSVRTGTAIARSNVPLRKWALAIYLCLTSLKSVSSMKLHRDIGVSQKTAWFMLHRIREAWQVETGGVFAGPVEVDETFIGGKAHNMHASRRAQLTGRGWTDKVAVAGIKDRQTRRVRVAVVPNTDGPTPTPTVRGTFHKLSPKHLDRYVQEFAGKHNMRESGTLSQMRNTVAQLVGSSLLYRTLTADNGLSSGAKRPGGA